MRRQSSPVRHCIAATLALAALSYPLIAAAQSAAAVTRVDQARAEGAVGEQADGFLGFVALPVDPELRAAVAEVNDARQRVYVEAAQRNGVTPEVAGVATFKALFDTKLKSGDHYRDETGIWRRK